MHVRYNYVCAKSTYKDIFQFSPVALAHNMSKGQLKDKMKYIKQY